MTKKQDGATQPTQSNSQNMVVKDDMCVQLARDQSQSIREGAPPLTTFNFLI